MRSDRAPSGTMPIVTVRVVAGDDMWTTTATVDTSGASTPLGRLRAILTDTSPVAPAIEMGCVLTAAVEGCQRVGLAADGDDEGIHVDRGDVVAGRRRALNDRR